MSIGSENTEPSSKFPTVLEATAFKTKTGRSRGQCKKIWLFSRAQGWGVQREHL